MPITVDNTSTTTASATQISAEHICTGTESNGILIVTVQVVDATLGDRTISTVTHNNEACTHLPGSDSDDATNGLRTEIWYRTNPTTGGAPNIVVTAGGKCTDLTYGAISLTGVNSAESLDTYYFDASDAGPNDPDTAWNNDAYAFDDDPTPNTYADTNFDELVLEGTGTNAPTTGNLIIKVEARLYGGGHTPRWGGWETLIVPSGGWTWQKVNDLEVEFFRGRGGAGAYVVEARIKHSGVELQLIVVGPWDDVGPARAYRAEVRVTSVAFVVQTAADINTPPTLDITTVGSSSYAVDSLSSGESDGTKITEAHTAIHKTDVGADTHAAQYVDAGGAGAQTMNYSDTDADTRWVLAAMAVKIAAVAAARRVFVTQF